MPTMLFPRLNGSADPETTRVVSARRQQLWATCKSLRCGGKINASPVESDTGVTTSHAKAPRKVHSRNASSRILKRHESCIFLPEESDDDDDDDDISLDPFVGSAPPEMTSAMEHQSFTLRRSPSFQLSGTNRGAPQLPPKTEITIQPLTRPTKPIRAASVLMKEDALDHIVFASKTPGLGLRMKFLGHTKSSPMIPKTDSENSQTDSSTNESSHSASHSDEEESSSNIAAKFFENVKLFDCGEGKVSFGLPQIATVQSWKGEDLWWTRKELVLSHASQSAQLIGNDKAKRYMKQYQQAQEELQLSQIYNLDGKPYLEKLPGGVKRGLREGHAGLEVFSSLENRRRVRGRAIVRSVIDLSSRTNDPMQLREHSERLNAPNLYWAIMVAKAHQRYDRFIDI